MSKGKVFITGQKQGLPTFDQLLAMTKRLTGRDPTETELAEAEAKWDEFLEQKAEPGAGISATPDAPEKSRTGD